MGHVIQELVSKSDDTEIVFCCDPRRRDSKSLSDITKVERNPSEVLDVYVDFTSPDAVVGNVELASKIGIDSVIGTTGWYDHLDHVKRIANEHGRRVLYAPNFSPGVNVLFHTAQNLAKLLANFGYDVAVFEAHHTAKVDAPSGTAITLGNILLKEMGKERLTYERRDKRADAEIDVLGIRIGKVAGHHEVWFTPRESYSERLILQHDIFNPEILGIGALIGVRWVAEAQKEPKAAGLYNFYEDVLELPKI